MSNRVIFTCSLIMFFGVGGVLDSAAALSKGQVHINLFILLFPVGIALFMALPGARQVATIVFTILYLFLVLLLLGPSIGLSSTHVQFLRSDLPFMSSFPVVLVFVAMLGSVLALLHWMLFSPAFEEHLDL